MEPSEKRVADAVADETARTRLLTSAISLFARKGYAATTVREIVAEAGVTKPVLYYHFGNKEGLFLEMMRGALQEFDATVARTLSAGGTARERIHRFLAGMFGLVLDNIDVMRVVDAVYYGPPQGAPYFDFEVIHRSFMATLTELVREGMGAGAFKAGDPEETAWALVGCFEVVRGMSLCHPEMGFDRERLGRLVDVVLHGVLAEQTRE